MRRHCGFFAGQNCRIVRCKYQHWLASVMIILANSPVSLQIDPSGSICRSILREARRLQDRQIQLSLDRSRQWILVGPLRMSGPKKIQKSSKKMRHKRRSHAFHLTLFVDQGWTREEVNPEMKCQGQVSPLQHILLLKQSYIAVTIFPKKDTNLTQTMKGWILHRFNCISWLRICLESRSELYKCAYQRGMSIFCFVAVVNWSDAFVWGRCPVQIVGGR